MVEETIRVWAMKWRGKRQPLSVVLRVAWHNGLPEGPRMANSCLAAVTLPLFDQGGLVSGPGRTCGAGVSLFAGTDPGYRPNSARKDRGPSGVALMGNLELGGDFFAAGTAKYFYGADAHVGRKMATSKHCSFDAQNEHAEALVPAVVHAC